MRRIYLFCSLLMAVMALGGCAADQGVKGVKHVVMIGLDGLADPVMALAASIENIDSLAAAVCFIRAEFNEALFLQTV